jgi:RNA recognition motif-containing protein
MNIYIGNLSRDVTEDDLRQTFQTYGTVDSVSIIKDKFSGISKGFAFVEMPVKEEAEAAMTALKGKELKGRPLDCNEARPREERRPNRGGGRGKGRNGGGGGGGGGRRGPW